MMLLSVDPGIRGCGVAIWCDKFLMIAAYVKSEEREEGGPLAAWAVADAVVKWMYEKELYVDRLVVEWPQTYGGRAARGDTNDLLLLAAVGGALAGNHQFIDVSHVTPHEWKGNIPKPKRASEPYIITQRVLNTLIENEQSHVEWPKNKKLSWDVVDALGIGLHALGRWKR